MPTLRSSCAGGEQNGDVDHKHPHRQRKREDSKQQEQRAGAMPHYVGGDIGDRARAIPHRGDQATGVMHRADEDTSHHNPDERRKPSPHHSDCRSQKWPQSGDRGEVMPKQHRRRRRDIVYVVALGMRWSRGGIVYSKNLFDQEGSIPAISDPQDKRNEKDYPDRRQRTPLLLNAPVTKNLPDGETFCQPVGVNAAGR
ncbi:hypothetical protein HRbin16_02353 [bacterium HR16]|nr:hypothetical protein HRbin16_02353 [bacterium HR16]